MKCGACKYEYDFRYNSKSELEIIKGDEKFIEISGHFYKNENFEDKRIYFAACPKCMTIRIDE